MDPKSETAVSKLCAVVIEVGWQTPAASRSNRRAATAIPLYVYAPPCCEQLVYKIMRREVLNTWQLNITSGLSGNQSRD